ncbi:MAG: AzlD domain-containing protein, partial [Pseudomonadota bacterium]
GLMDGAYVWAVIIGLGVASALIRYSFLGFLRGRDLPTGLQRALGFVPVAAFPAIFMPMVMFDAAGDWAELSRPVAAAAALIVGVASRSMLAAILAGMTALLLFG